MVDRVVRVLVIVGLFHAGLNKHWPSEYLGTVVMATKYTEKYSDSKVYCGHNRAINIPFRIRGKGKAARPSAEIHQ